MASPAGRARVRTIQQPRAARTAERLSQAALELMETKPLAQVSVAEIVGRAGLSVGAFYARFGCKEALVDWLCEHRLHRAGTRMAAELQRLDAGAAPLREVVGWYVDTALRFFERNAVLLREVVRIATADDGAGELPATRDASWQVDRAFVASLMARVPGAEAAASFAVTFVASVLRAYILFPGQLPAAERRRSRAALKTELVEWLVARLGSTAAR